MTRDPDMVVEDAYAPLDASSTAAPDVAPPPSRAARAFLWAWAAVVVVVCAYLLGAHVLTLPQPTSTDPALVAAMQRVRAAEGATGAGRWIVVHALDADCGCSQRVLHALLQRAPAPGAVERIVMVGDLHDPTVRPAALARGYRYEEITSAQLAGGYHLEAAPVLVIADPAGTVRYVGGYTARKQGAVIHDVEFLSQLRAGHAVTPLPVFGCAVSARLRTSLDPLGLR